MFEVTIIKDLLSKGGPIMLILIGMSIISLAIILTKILKFYSCKISSESSLKHIKGNKSEILESINLDTKNPCNQIILTLIETRDWSKENAENELRRIGEKIITSYSFLLKPLEVISNLSPLLGLLGTIIGMINAFANLQAAGSNIDPSLLAGGIWQALLTTALGLIVAIPSLASYFWFESKVDNLREELRHTAIRSSNLLEDKLK
tara:strand:+ start:172 stop:789 length:618 start_codon:yes stop_codon:yes gene_type:complete